MKILLCNERFLFRFGVDRVLMILGMYFKKMGHTVIMMGNRLDEKAVQVCTDRFIKVPEAPEYFNSNEFVQGWLSQNWDDLFPSQQDIPDIAFVAGWPFYESLSILKEKCGVCIFHDYGAVPLDKMEGGTLLTQQKLRKLRADNLSKADKIIAISRFLEESQSKPDAQNLISTGYIHLGTDHMELGLWSKQDLKLEESQTVEEVQQLKKEGCNLIFLLGRFEFGNYKNSEQSFELLREIKRKISNVRMLILAQAEDISVPDDLKGDIKFLGFVSDDDLQALMKLCDVGISMSLWEGFNLPLSEMQLLKRPVYVFNVGAHPEVVIDPYYLCDSLADMNEKVILQLQGKERISPDVKREQYLRFKEYFTWQRCAVELLDEFSRLLYQKNEIVVFIDVTNASHDTANSGVMRVTRHISKNIQERAETVFILWDKSIEKYVFPYPEEVGLLCAYGGPEKEKIKLCSTDGMARKCLDEYLPVVSNREKFALITETIDEIEARKIRKYFKNNNTKLIAIFYDAIAVLHPELCNIDVAENHKIYMRGLGECNLVVPISQTSEGDLIAFWDTEKISPTTVCTDLLPGELEGTERVKENHAGARRGKPVSILCVSTLEPRKNHKRLLQAFLMLAEKHPELDWRLTLIGNRYAGNTEIPEYVTSISKRESRIKWLGVVDDAALKKAYQDADFTIYPSVIEGFGMPIMESLWAGKPCICSDNGVMAELGKEGGCLLVNVLDEKSIMEGIYTLASDTEQLQSLTEEAINRPIRTWKEYTICLLDSIYRLSDRGHREKERIFNRFLFGEKTLTSSTANISMKTAIFGITELIRPACVISLGNNENLSLFTENVPLVYTISDAQAKRTAANHFALNGTVSEVLPVLLDELKHHRVPVSLLYLAQDYSDFEGLVDILNAYHSTIPLLVMLEGNKTKINWDRLTSLRRQDSFPIPGDQYNIEVVLLCECR
ncbi:glycosyltransferase [Anaerotruncus sp. X29]|nr:glycosyltransferase [Anaerotruncus sp. X29]